MAKAYLVGSGIASLSAAAFLIRQRSSEGSDMVILEEQDRVCTGCEILDEVLHHLHVEDAPRILENSIVIPALMPYTTSQFLVRKAGDRPEVGPEGSTNLAFIGKYAEVPGDVVFTVEYSVRTAWTAVATLLTLDRQPPPVHKGGHDPKVLVEALATMHRR